MTDQLGLFDARRLPSAEPAHAPLRVRESSRARYLTLRLLPPQTLELVVPRGTRAEEISAFVTEHRGWIERARRELARYRPARSEGLPAHIELAAIGEQWRVEYRHDPTAPPRCRVEGGVINVGTQSANLKGADAVLRSWLLDQADYHLAPWLLREAARIGRRPTAVQVRLQRTRWGSCSARGTVSLNAALLFLPPELVRYLFVHELCHLLVLSHSRKFWATVEHFEPDYLVLDRRLTKAWTGIPLWAHPRSR